MSRLLLLVPTVLVAGHVLQHPQQLLEVHATQKPFALLPFLNLAYNLAVACPVA